jgi:hypothetical protein
MRQASQTGDAALAALRAVVRKRGGLKL